MREYDDIFLNGQEFDTLLAESLTELPPGEEMIHDITPWRRAMSRILWGYGLTSLTLNFFCLNYLLPAIGIVLMLLGFRALRQENGWFKVCWVLSVLRALWLIFQLSANATVWTNRIYGNPVVGVLGYANLALVFVLTLCLWQALRAVHIKAGFAPGARAAFAMAMWYFIICLLALVKYSGLVIGGVIIVAYILILRSLHRLSVELDEAGYAVTPAAVRLPDRSLKWGLFALMAIGIAVGYLCFNSYPMDWELTDGTGQNQNAEIREHLISLGYPEEVIYDLTPEDLAACEGALDVVAKVRDYPVNEGREVRETTNYPTHNSIHIYTAYDVEELRLINLAVKLPGERETWKIFHHFVFTVNPGFHGTEAMQFWPTDRLDGWGNRSEPTGRLLYDRDGKTYTASYYSLEDRTYTSNSMFWGTTQNRDLFAEFSLPGDGERQRGYVSYEVQEMRDGCIIDSWVNYIHRESWLQYPVKTALETRLTTGFNDGPIRTVQDAIQFYPNDEDPQPFGE